MGHKLTDTQHIAFVLGGTVPHIDLVKKLQNRGFYVILIDYLANPPAKPFANEHLQISTLDYEAVLKAAKERKPSLVISVAVDQANAICCRISEALSLPHPYSYETAQRIACKDKMKQAMLDAHIPTAPFISAPLNVTQIQEKIGFPCVIKPANGGGSRGVHVASLPNQLQFCVERAIASSRTHEAIAESFIDGIEISAYFHFQQGAPHLLSVCQKSDYTDRAGNSVRQYESVIYPAQISDEAIRKIKGIAQEIGALFGFMNTPLMLQAIVRANDDVNVLEFAPRMGGGLCFRAIPLLTGFDYTNAAIASFLGEPIDEFPLIDSARCLYIGNVFAKQGIFDHVEGVEEALSQGIIEEFYCTKSKDAAISPDGSAGSRFGQFISLGENKQDLLERGARARTLIRAISPDGIDISAHERTEIA